MAATTQAARLKAGRDFTVGVFIVRGEINY
jgi:hypothetical protein